MTCCIWFESLVSQALTWIIFSWVTMLIEASTGFKLVYCCLLSSWTFQNISKSSEGIMSRALWRKCSRSEKRCYKTTMSRFMIFSWRPLINYQSLHSFQTGISACTVASRQSYSIWVKSTSSIDLERFLKRGWCVTWCGRTPWRMTTPRAVSGSITAQESAASNSARSL